MCWQRPGDPTQPKRQPLLNQSGEAEPLAGREGLGLRQQLIIDISNADPGQDLVWSYLQMVVPDAPARLMEWLLITLQELELRIPSRRARRKQERAWFSQVELTPRSAADQTPQPAVA